MTLHERADEILRNGPTGMTMLEAVRQAKQERVEDERAKVESQLKKNGIDPQALIARFSSK